MKNFKLLSVLAACLAAFAFTSCNTGDDGYSYLTLEQQKNYQSAMAGSYTDMKILWDHKNDADVKNQSDSIDTQVSISMYGDSTMYVTNFPVAKLAEHINNAELKEAIAGAANQNIKVKYMVLPNSTQTVAYFYACPQPIELNLTYGEASHKVTLYFTYNSYYTGYCQWSTKQMGFPFYLYQIWVDGKQTNYVQNSTSSSSTSVSLAIRNAWKKSN